MGDSLHHFCLFLFIIRKVILQDKIATKRKNQVLKDVNWSLSTEQEHEVTQESALALGRLQTLFHLLHFWSILKLFINSIIIVVIPATLVE